MPTLRISALVVLALLPGIAQRYRPPAAVACDRNNLTSYTGEVTQYARKAGQISLTLKTDADTVESVTFAPGDKILLNAEAITEDGWKHVEEKEGKLKPGMRATAWVCRGGRPVLDWQPPQR